VLSGYRGHPGQVIPNVIHFSLISGLRFGSQIPPKTCWIPFCFFGDCFYSVQICFWSASALLLCCVWFASGLLLRAFRAFWGGLAHSGTVSGACWDDFGVFRSILGQCREHVGASWSVFGSMLGHLALSWSILANVRSAWLSGWAKMARSGSILIPQMD